VLVLDEPTAGLRAREANDLVGLIGQLAADLHKTVLLIEHNMSVVASVSQQIVVLNFGRKIADGEAASVLGDPAVVDAYLGAPLESETATPHNADGIPSAEGQR
jgi:ABC-type branched-subunit amino acid transport system ATPase component